jgi:hypothetical protein
MRAAIKQQDRPQDFTEFLAEMERRTEETFARSRAASRAMKSALARSREKKRAA